MNKSNVSAIDRIFKATLVEASVEISPTSGTDKINIKPYELNFNLITA